MNIKGVKLKLQSLFIIAIIVGQASVSIFGLNVTESNSKSNLLLTNKNSYSENDIIQRMNNLFIDFLNDISNFNNIDEEHFLNNNSITYNITENENETIIAYINPFEIYSKQNFSNFDDSLSYLLTNIYSVQKIKSWNIFKINSFYNKEEIKSQFLQSLNELVLIGVNITPIDFNFIVEINKLLSSNLSNSTVIASIKWILEDGTSFISTGLFDRDTYKMITDSFLITIAICCPTQMRILKDPTYLSNTLPSSDELLARITYAWYRFIIIPWYIAFDLFELYIKNMIIDPYIPINEIGNFNFTFYVKHASDRFPKGFHWEAVPLTKIWYFNVSNSYGDIIQINNIDSSQWVEYDTVLSNNTNSVTIDFLDLGLMDFIYGNPNHDFKVLTQNNALEPTITTNFISIFGKINVTSSSNLTRKLNVKIECSTELPFIPTGIDFWIRSVTPTTFERGVYYLADNNNTPSLTADLVSSVDKNIKFNLTPIIKNEKFHAKIKALKFDVDISNESAVEDITDSSNPYGPSNVSHEILVTGLNIEPNQTYSIYNLYSFKALDYANVTLDIKIVGWEYEISSNYYGMTTTDPSGFRSILVVDSNNITITPQAYPDFINYLDEYGTAIIRVEPGTQWIKIVNITNIGAVLANGTYLEIRKLSDNKLIGLYDSKNYSFPNRDSIGAGDWNTYYITCNDTKKGLNTEYFLVAQLYYQVNGENQTSDIINFPVSSKFSLSIDLLHYPRIQTEAASWEKTTNVIATIENFAEFTDLNFSIFRNLGFSTFQYPGKVPYSSLADIMSQAASTALGVGMDGHLSLTDMISAILDMAFYFGLSEWLYRQKVLSLPIGYTDNFNFSVNKNSSYSFTSPYFMLSPHWVMSQLDFDRAYEFGNPLSYVGQGFTDQWYAVNFYGEAFDKFGNTYNVEASEVAAPTWVPPAHWLYKDWGDALGLLAISYLWIGIIFTGLFILFVAGYIASWGLNIQLVMYAAESLLQIIYRFGGMGLLTLAALGFYTQAALSDPEKNDELIIPTYNKYITEIPNQTSSTLLNEHINNVYKLEGDMEAFSKSYNQLYNASEEGEYNRAIYYSNLSENFLDLINEDLLKLAVSTDNIYEESELPSSINITNVFESFKEEDFLNNSIDNLKDIGYSDFEINLSLETLNHTDSINASKFLSNKTLMKAFDYLSLYTINHVMFNFSQEVEEIKINCSLKQNNETIKTADFSSIAELETLIQNINSSIENENWIGAKNYTEELLLLSNEIILNTYNKSYLSYKNFAKSELNLIKDSISVHTSSNVIDATPNSESHSSIRIKNTGKVNDTYKIQFFDEDPTWNINDWLDCSTVNVTLEPNEIKNINFTVHIPEIYNYSKLYEFKINISSTNFINIFDVADTYIRIHNYTATLNQPISQIIEPGGIKNYSITFKNYGNRNETIYIFLPNIESISSRSTNGWVRYEQKITLMPGEIKNTSIFIFPPKDCTTHPGNYSLDFVFLSELIPNLKYNQTGQLRILDTEFYNFDAKICDETKVVIPGDIITFEGWIKNWGSRNDTFNISVEGLCVDWVTVPSPINVVPCNNKSFLLGIHPSREFNITPGEYTFNLTIQSQNDITLTQKFTRSINITSYTDLEIDISPIHRVTTPYMEIFYQIMIKNLGNINEIFKINIDNLPEEWYSVPQSIILEPGQDINLLLEITPPNILPNIYEFTIKISSKSNPDIFRSKSCTFEMLPSALVEVVISPDNLILMNNSILQGDYANFALEIINRGNIPDIFDIKILSLGKLQLYLESITSNTELLQPSEKFQTFFHIYCPINESHLLFTPGEYLVYVQATSRYNSSIRAFDKSILTVGEVKTVRNFSIDWQNQSFQKVAPGNFVEYPFKINNNGNVWDIYNITIGETDILDPIWFKFNFNEDQTYEHYDFISLTMNPDVNVSIFLNISVPGQLITSGNYSFSINIKSIIDPDISYNLTATLEILPLFGIYADILPEKLSIFDNEIAIFNISICNLGTEQDTFLFNLSEIDTGIVKLYLKNGTEILDELILGPNCSEQIYLKIIPIELGEETLNINISSKNAIQMGYTDIWTNLSVIISINDDDFTPPFINTIYLGMNNDGFSGHWKVFAIDNESGIEKIIVKVDNGVTFEIENGELIGVPNEIGSHNISVIAFNGDLDRGEKDQEISTKFDIQEIIDDDISPPIINNLQIDDNVTSIIITFQAFDESDISNFEFNIDGKTIQPINYFSIGNNFSFEFNNEWIFEYGQHYVKINITDGDNDRLNDSLSSIVEGQFNTSAIDIVELIKMEILQLQQEININISRPYQKILNCKLQIILDEINWAERAYYGGHLTKAILLEKLAKINLEICELIIQIGDCQNKIKEDIAQYLTQQVHKIRNHITYSMGAIIGTETALEIAEIEIDLNNFADQIDNLTIFWKAFLINIHIWQGCDKLDQSLIYLSLNNTNRTEICIVKCIRDLNLAKHTVSLMSRLGMISDELAVELKSEIDHFIIRLENVFL